MVKTLTHYVGEDFRIRIRRLWLVLIFIKTGASLKIGEIFWDEGGLILGLISAILLMGITAVKGILMEFSDEYEDYVEDCAPSRGVEVWIRER